MSFASKFEAGGGPYPIWQEVSAWGMSGSASAGTRLEFILVTIIPARQVQAPINPARQKEAVETRSDHTSA